MYGFFYKEYGLRKEEVDALDSVVVRKALIVHRVKRELEEP